MVEADGAADEEGARAAAAVAEELVAVADPLEREVEDRRCRRARLAAQEMPFPWGTSVSSPARSHSVSPPSVSSQTRPDVTTWNQTYPGIAGSVRPHGSVRSERQ